ncbi:MAG: helix-turn-helix domain-containing protein [Eubacteriales bacterium]
MYKKLSEEKIDKLKSFLDEGLTYEKIAEKLDVNERTIRRWKKIIYENKPITNKNWEEWSNINAESLINAGFNDKKVPIIISALGIAKMQGNARLHKYLSSYINVHQQFPGASESWWAMFSGLPILAEDIDAQSMKELTELAKLLNPYESNGLRKQYKKEAKTLMMKVLADVQCFLMDAASAGGFPITIVTYGGSLFPKAEESHWIDESLVESRVTYMVPSETAKKYNDFREIVDKTWAGVLFDIVSRLPNPDKKRGKVFKKLQLTDVLYGWFSKAPADFQPPFSTIKRTPKDKLGHTIAGSYYNLAYKKDE